jgi:propionate CoA-transferase
VEDGKLVVRQDGSGVKFKKAVEQITFSSIYAQETNQTVLFITERAVFRLLNGKVTLTEIAPGVDLQKHILDKMEFKPEIAPDLKLMDMRLFREKKMGLSF